MKTSENKKAKSVVISFRLDRSEFLALEQEGGNANQKAKEIVRGYLNV